MDLTQDVNSKFFRSIDTASDLFPVRSVVGRMNLCGFGIMPTYRILTSGGELSVGTIKLENVNAALNGTSGTVVMEFPVVSPTQYSVTSFCSLLDDDGGILFENGIYLNDTTELGSAPLINFAIVLFFSGPGGVTDA